MAVKWNFPGLCRCYLKYKPEGDVSAVRIHLSELLAGQPASGERDALS